MYLSDASGALVDDDAHAPRASSASARVRTTHTAPPADAPDQICIVRAEDMAPGQPLRSRHDADAWPRPRRQPPLGRLLPYGASPPSLLLPASRTPRRPTPPLSRTHSQRSLASSPRSSPGVAVGTRSVSVVTPTFNNKNKQRRVHGLGRARNVDGYIHHPGWQRLFWSQRPKGHLRCISRPLGEREVRHGGLRPTRASS